MRAPDFYPHGQHPYWCDLGEYCRGGDDPNHVGRTSHLFVQLEEARVSVQLSRIDNSSIPAGTRLGSVQVRLTLNQGEGVGFAEAELSIDEAQSLALLLKQYVAFATREDGSDMSATAESVLANGPA